MTLHLALAGKWWQTAPVVAMNAMNSGDQNNRAQSIKVPVKWEAAVAWVEIAMSDCSPESLNFLAK